MYQNLPRGFACKVLQNMKSKSKITLVPADLEKRSKGCTAAFHKNKSMRCIGKGWPKFAQGNGLKEGDFCLFELRKEQKQGKLLLTMVVHFDH
jgi:B3 DNA binding domain